MVNSSSHEQHPDCSSTVQASYGALLVELDARLAHPAFRWLPTQLAASVDWRKCTAFDSIRY